MKKEKIKDYLKRSEELGLKLTGKDKDTYQWLIFGYNECAKLLNETEQENQQLKIQLLEKKCSNKDIEYKEKIKLQKRIDKAIEYIEKDYKFANYDIPLLTKDEQLAGKLLEILKDKNDE